MAYITINDLNGIPAEIFLNVGKAGSDVFAMAEALGRVCSLFLRYGDHGQKVELLVKHLKGIGGSGAIGFGVNRVESIADAVAKALETHVQANAIDAHGLEVAPIAATLDVETPNGEHAQLKANSAGQHVHSADSHATDAAGKHGTTERGAYPASLTATAARDLCPSCGSASLMNVEGCKTCSNCGYSRCS